MRTPNTDILFILLHHADSIALAIYLDCGVGKHCTSLRGRMLPAHSWVTVSWASEEASAEH